MRIGPIELKAFVLCDDIRREDNGKEIIIGIYGSDIRVSNIPGIARVTLWAQVQLVEPQEFDLSLRIVDDDGNVFAQVSGHFIPVPDEDMFSFGLVEAGLPISARTQLHCEITTDENWHRVRSFVVRKPPQPNVTH